MKGHHPSAALAALLLLVGGCAAGEVGRRAGDGDDTLPSTRADGAPDDGGDGPGGAADTSCETDVDCPGAQVCLEFGGSRRCVSRSGPGDGTDCGPCDGGECRDGVCIHPDGGGAVCEFDPECGDDMLCIAGRCTPDPREERMCSDDTDCPGGLSCGIEGICICAVTADCPVGFLCVAGRCDPGGGCVEDADCPGDMLCEAGACIDRGACDVVHPDLSGRWNLTSVLRLREALPGWLDGFLAAVAGPFHFIAGHTMDLDLGLPGFVEDLVADFLRDWADRSLPPWLRSLLGAIADLNDILSTWYVEEQMALTGAGARDVYTGDHWWNVVEFEYRGMRVRGRPEDIIDWRFEPSTFEANASCGRFNIHRHDVNVSIGAIVAWLVNTIVYEATDGRYRTLMEALDAATAGFCDAAARGAGGAVDFPGVELAVSAWCTSELGDLTSRLVDAVTGARLDADLMSLKGHAPIVSATSMTPGTWEGTLAGGDFTGDFTAWR